MKITFPNLLLIPLFSIIGIVLKAFNLTQYDWLNVILSIPVGLYFIWCVGYCVLSVLGLLMIALYRKFK